MDKDLKKVVNWTLAEFILEEQMLNEIVFCWCLYCLGNETSWKVTEDKCENPCDAGAFWGYR